jgi:hypothetical protein
MNDPTNETKPDCAASRAEGANLTGVLEAVGDGWTRATVEEAIGVLWAIAAVMCFGFGFTGAGWVFAIKSMIDLCIAILVSVQEGIAKKRAYNAEVTGAPTTGATKGEEA